jgi:hypothetical protein
MYAALAYANGAAHNAAVLMVLGEAAKLSADPNIAAAGARMAEAAVQLRLVIFAVRWKLWLLIALPGLDVALIPLADRYNVVKQLAWHLGRLQNPSTAARVSAAL